MCEQALRRTGSTMAAEGHVFAVAGSGAGDLLPAQGLPAL